MDGKVIIENILTFCRISHNSERGSNIIVRPTDKIFQESGYLSNSLRLKRNAKLKFNSDYCGL
jgi:hypothetical protein